MKNFNTTRFMNYGRYDSAINKTYYRNMSLVAIFIICGLAVVGFLGRWAMYKMSGGDEFSHDPMTSYADTPLTTMILLGATSMLTLVFAGCTFHNMRTKQGRIFELTIPATNIEKYVWHLLVSIVGGLTVCFVGLGLADALNALLNLLMYPSDAQHSLIVSMYEAMTLGSAKGMPANASAVFNSLGLMGIGYAFFNLGFYVFGNSLKYRFNIIITYGIQQIMFTLIYIALIVIGVSGGFDGMTPNTVTILFYAVSGILAVLGCLCFWGAYKRYGKAVITSKLNK